MSDEAIRVLLIEDNPGDVRLVQEVLREAGNGVFEIAVAGTFAEAKDQLQNQRYSAALLDLSLPDANGLDSVRGIVAAAPETAIIVLTGRADEKMAMEARQLGAQDYLLKLDIDGLAEAIRSAIERQGTPG